jgi:acetyl esterase/lipase
MALPARPWYRRPSRLIPIGLLVLGLMLALVSTLSPWPAALLIRGVFENSAHDTVTEMQPFVPRNALDAQLGLSYDHDKPDTVSPLATVVWIHGGAWISGSKENVDPYAEIIASHGYTTITLDYTIAPDATYPTALGQLNTALGYLVAHAAALHIDPSRMVVAGDSAGAQLTSQLATIVTNPAYAAEVGITPALTTAQLRAVILDCGIYDLRDIPSAPGIGGWGFRIALWAYLGTKDWSPIPGAKQMTTLTNVTSAFPATWISGGNADPLTPHQSKAFAARLQSLGVDVTPVFYSDGHEPALPHEYQFHLKLADARAALQSTLDFLARVTSRKA